MLMCVMCMSTYEYTCTCVCLYVETRGHLWDSSPTARLMKGNECMCTYLWVVLSHTGIHRDQAYADIQTFPSVTVHLTF